MNRRSQLLSILTLLIVTIGCDPASPDDGTETGPPVADPSAGSADTPANEGSAATTEQDAPADAPGDSAVDPGESTGDPTPPPMPSRPGGNPLPSEATMHGLTNEDLIGRSYFADADGAEFLGFQFLDSLIVITMADGTMVPFVADMSGTHPLCADVPACVILIDREGNTIPFYFTAIFGEAVTWATIARAECSIAWSHRNEQWGLIREQIIDRAQGDIVHSSNGAVCWNPRHPPYRDVPRWWTPRDEMQFREQRIEAENAGGGMAAPPSTLSFPDPDNAASGDFGPLDEDGNPLPTYNAPTVPGLTPPPPVIPPGATGGAPPAPGATPP